MGTAFLLASVGLVLLAGLLGCRSAVADFYTPLTESEPKTECATGSSRDTGSTGGADGGTDGSGDTGSGTGDGGCAKQ